MCSSYRNNILQKKIKSKLFFFVTIIVLILISACTPTELVNEENQMTEILPSATIQPTATITEIPTSTPTNTPEPTPTLTPIPGEVVIPIGSMQDEIPWLENMFDSQAMPGTMFYAFNTTKPPFNDPLVRKAFAAAVDRQAVADLATRYYWNGVQPATTFIPSLVLGRNLYNQIGIPFDPTLAQELLAQAGYENPDSFPKTTLYISASTSDAPGSYQIMADAIKLMWQETLGVEVEVKSIGYVRDLASYMMNNPNGYDLYRMGFYLPSSEDMDPNLIDVFHSNDTKNNSFNYAHFENDDFDRLLDRARDEPDPLKRQLLYIEAEMILCESEAAVIPLYYYTVP